MNRRRFLELAAVGSAGAAALALPAIAPAAQRLVGRRGGSAGLQVQAKAGVPPSPWPAYATQMIEGRVDLERRTGLLTSRIVAGHPGDPSNVDLPGMTRRIRVTSVSGEGAALRLRGVVENADRSRIAPGESADIELLVDQAKGVLHTLQNNHELVLQLA